MGFPFSAPWVRQAIEKGLIRPADARPVAPLQQQDMPTAAQPSAAVGIGFLLPLLDPPALDASEKQLQAKVKQLAEGNGWLFFHPFDSRKSEPGYPDCTMVRGPVLIFAELKATAGTFTDEQKLWLRALEAVAAVKVFRWRPADWPEIVLTLTARP